MNLGNILADVYRRTNLPSSPSTADATRITAFVNETHRELLTAPGLEQLRDDTIQFSSVAAQATYALPQAIARIKDIYTPISNYWKLRKLSLPRLRENDPGLTATGNPEYYVDLGSRHVQKQPAATGSGVWAVSSSGSDTTQTVHVEGVELTGYATPDQTCTLSGTSRVQVGTLTDFIEIDKFYLSAVAVGTVSLYDASSNGNLLATIPIGKTNPTYWWIQLYPNPAGILAYNVDYIRKILDLVNSTDEPFLPEDFHDLLMIGGRWKEYEYRSDSRAQQTALAFQKRRSELFQWVINTPDYKPVPDKIPTLGGSNLGGAYPVGRW